MLVACTSFAAFRRKDSCISSLCRAIMQTWAAKPLITLNQYPQVYLTPYSPVSKGPDTHLIIV